MPDSDLIKEGLYQSFKSKPPRFPKLNPFAANMLVFLMQFTSNSSLKGLKLLLSRSVYMSEFVKSLSQARSHMMPYKQMETTLPKASWVQQIG